MDFLSPHREKFVEILFTFTFMFYKIKKLNLLRDKKF